MEHGSDAIGRRQLLRMGICTAAMAVVPAAACSAPETPPPLGLLPADELGLMLPAGFRARVVARTGQWLPGGYWWHSDPDGGAVFAREGGGWTYVSNCESVPGGVGALDFGPDGVLERGRPLLAFRTMANCAGGATPWGTWLSCEEHPMGRVWEVDPRSGAVRVHSRMGVFRHEAAAVDPEGRAVYLTEDERDGRLYRYVPTRWPDLSTGALSVARVEPDGALSWLPVPNPTPTLTQRPTRHQVAASSAFDGGEGASYRDGHVYVTTKGDQRVWDLDLRGQRCTVLYDAANGGDLRGVDNVLAAGSGLYVAEDGGNMELVLVAPDGRTVPCLRVVGQDRSELTGPAFDPSGTRLYLSSQRGTGGAGITYEVTGPFDRFRAAVLGRV